MTLGLALILIFILYSLTSTTVGGGGEKVVGLVALVFSVGGFYGWTKYGEYRTAKQQRRSKLRFRRASRIVLP